MQLARVRFNDVELLAHRLFSNSLVVLLKYGIPDEKIQNMSRWTRIGLIRQISSKAAAAGQASDSLSKYAR